MRRDSRYGDMTITMRLLLSELYVHGRADCVGSKFLVRGSEVRFRQETIDAAYDRALIKIVHTNHIRAKVFVELTEIGQYAAAGLLTKPNAIRPVSEAASLMITEALTP